MPVGMISGAAAFHSVFPQELVHTARGVDQLLLAGEEGMAFGADVDFHITYCGTGNELVTTGTVNGGHVVLWVNFVSHDFSSIL